MAAEDEKSTSSNSGVISTAQDDERDQEKSDDISLPAHVPGSGSLDRLVDPARYYARAAVELRVYTVQWGDAVLPTIKNTTKKPLNVPLPGGKRLFLGPGKEGEIRARAAEHPPVAALVETGELKVVPDAGKSGGKGGGGGRGRRPGPKSDQHRI